MSDQAQNTPSICTQEFLPGAVETGPTNLVPGPDGYPSSLAVKREARWPNGKSLKVRLLNPPNDIVKNKVKIFAEVWETVANISFDWVDDGPADIRVGFMWPTPGSDGVIRPDKGSWSYLGTDAARYITDQSKPTMNYGWLYDYTPDQEYARTVIHEFGHALGCIHEHQNPSVTIVWNEDVVYAAMAAQGWTKEATDHNILKRVNAAEHEYSAFDPDSIMLYGFPASWTRDGKGTHSNFALSEADKAFIRKMYPPRVRNIGKYSTTQTRPWYPPVAINRTAISFDPIYDAEPKITIGLTQLDMDHSNNYRIQASATTVTNKGFDLNLDSWADTKLYAAGATWLEMMPTETSFDCGEFDTIEVRPDIYSDAQIVVDGETRFRRDTKRCNFASGKFSAKPKVIVWLKAFDTKSGANIRIWARATNISDKGFDLVIEGWADTKIYRAAASWFAHDASKTNVQSGAVSTRDYRDWYPAQINNGGNVTFAKGIAREPRVFAALSFIDMSSNANLRVNVGAESVSEQGFKWVANAWADTVCYQVGVDWIAFG